MLQIVLIRPGSTDYDRQERIQGTLDIPLDKQGTAELTQHPGQRTPQVRLAARHKRNRRFADPLCMCRIILLRK